jgi:hypothetical protein
MSHGAQITDRAALEPFLLAGRATVTLVSKQTGRRFTFKVEQRRIEARRAEETDVEYGERMAQAHAGPRFVKVMTGPDNENHYTYVGHIDEHRNFRLDRKSKLSPDAPSVSAWQWFWRAVVAKSERVVEQCEVWHDGRCGKCGRKLTVPQSVASGLGPVCAGK